MRRRGSDTASLRTDVQAPERRAVGDGDAAQDPSAQAALLIIDVQVDFCPGGALPVLAGDRVIPVLNRAIAHFHSRGWPVYASRDWHPADSTHFRTFGGRWPVHCIAGSRGAAFHPDLRLPADGIIISKGLNRAADGYSAFEGTDDQGRRLIDDLRQRRIDRLYVGGLATDYCVRASVTDACKAGLRVVVLVDAIAGIGPEDTRQSLEEMRAAGAILAHSDELDTSAESRTHTSTP